MNHEKSQEKHSKIEITKEMNRNRNTFKEMHGR